MLEDLLARIIANPDDLDARAVYADALTEAGDPRGELITVELALQRLGIDTMDDYVFSPLEGDALERAAGLMRRVLVLRPTHRVLKRGFEVSAISSYFDKLATALATSPIEVLVPDSSLPLAKVLELPLANIRQFHLGAAKDLHNVHALFAAMPKLESLGANCAFDVSSLAPCTKLRSIGGYHLDLDGIAKLPCAKTITKISVTRTPSAFRAAERFPALERLEIHDAVEPVADKLPRELRLTGIERWERLAALPAMADVESLEIPIHNFPADPLFAIVTSPYLERVKKLSLRGDAPRAYRALVDKRGARLEWLSLESAPLPGDVVAAIVRAHRLAYLHWTPLGGGPGHAALANEPAAASLRSLMIFGAYLGDEGAATIASSPHLSKLRRLTLGKNVIFKRGRAALAGSPHLRGVVELELSFNGDTAYLVFCDERADDEKLLRGAIAPFLELDRRGGLAGGIEIEDEALHIAAFERLAGVTGHARIVRIPRDEDYDALPIARAIRDVVGGVLFDTSTETRL